MGLVKLGAAVSTRGGERYQKSVEFLGSCTLLRFSVGQLLSGVVLPPASAAACRARQRRCEMALNALASVLKFVLFRGEDIGPSWALCWQHQLGYSP